MDEIVGFKTLRVGQHVKIKGKARHDGALTAVEISPAEPTDEVEIDGEIQAIDLRQHSLRLCHQEFCIAQCMTIRHPEHAVPRLPDLHPGMLVRLKGAYSSSRGFTVAMIETRETKEFNIDRVYGAIERIDRQAHTLQLVGFTVLVNANTMIAES